MNRTRRAREVVIYEIPDRMLDDKINLEHECAFSLSLQSRRRAFVDFPIDINQAVPFSADIITDKGYLCIIDERN